MYIMFALKRAAKVRLFVRKPKQNVGKVHKRPYDVHTFSEMCNKTFVKSFFSGPFLKVAFLLIQRTALKVSKDRFSCLKVPL